MCVDLLSPGILILKEAVVRVTLGKATLSAKAVKVTPILPALPVKILTVALMQIRQIDQIVQMILTLMMNVRFFLLVSKQLTKFALNLIH